MSERDQERLSELLAGLFAAEEAERVLGDLQEADQILFDHPAPKPSVQLLDQIKADMAVRLSARRVQLRHRRQRRVAAVAAVVVSAGIFVTLFNAGPEPVGLTTASLIPTAIWESSNIALDDEDLAVFTAEIDQIENEVMALESNDDISDSHRALDELEMELAVVGNDFWKE